ncbi:unnamed protein product [Calicophoron daubneyi]|uniref:Leucine-rich repeat and IQ domain-containing protein 1 n=1 Tax=Calicophoron daubneyi TaxID=300641 RepID=A0AAV2TAE0_CALDB
MRSDGQPARVFNISCEGEAIENNMGENIENEINVRPSKPASTIITENTSAFDNFLAKFRDLENSLSNELEQTTQEEFRPNGTDSEETDVTLSYRKELEEALKRIGLNWDDYVKTMHRIEADEKDEGSANHPASVDEGELEYFAVQPDGESSSERAAEDVYRSRESSEIFVPNTITGDEIEAGRRGDDFATSEDLDCVQKIHENPTRPLMDPQKAEDESKLIEKAIEAAREKKWAYYTDILKDTKKWTSKEGNAQDHSSTWFRETERFIPKEYADHHLELEESRISSAMAKALEKQLEYEKEKIERRMEELEQARAEEEERLKRIKELSEEAKKVQVECSFKFWGSQPTLFNQEKDVNFAEVTRRTPTDYENSRSASADRRRNVFGWTLPTRLGRSSSLLDIADFKRPQSSSHAEDFVTTPLGQEESIPPTARTYLLEKTRCSRSSSSSEGRMVDHSTEGFTTYPKEDRAFNDPMISPANPPVLSGCSSAGNLMLSTNNPDTTTLDRDPLSSGETALTRALGWNSENYPSETANNMKLGIDGASTLDKPEEIPVKMENHPTDFKGEPNIPRGQKQYTSSVIVKRNHSACVRSWEIHGALPPPPVKSTRRRSASINHNFIFPTSLPTSANKRPLTSSGLEDRRRHRSDTKTNDTITALAFRVLPVQSEILSLKPEIYKSPVPATVKIVSEEINQPNSENDETGARYFRRCPSSGTSLEKSANATSIYTLSDGNHGKDTSMNPRISALFCNKLPSGRDTLAPDEYPKPPCESVSKHIRQGGFAILPAGHEVTMTEPVTGVSSTAGVSQSDFKCHSTLEKSYRLCSYTNTTTKSAAPSSGSVASLYISNEYQDNMEEDDLASKECGSVQYTPRSQCQRRQKSYHPSEAENSTTGPRKLTNIKQKQLTLPNESTALKPTRYLILPPLSPRNAPLIRSSLTLPGQGDQCSAAIRTDVKMPYIANVPDSLITRRKGYTSRSLSLPTSGDRVNLETNGAIEKRTHGPLQEQIMDNPAVVSTYLLPDEYNVITDPMQSITPKPEVWIEDMYTTLPSQMGEIRGTEFHESSFSKEQDITGNKDKQVNSGRPSESTIKSGRLGQVEFIFAESQQRKESPTTSHLGEAQKSGTEQATMDTFQSYTTESEEMKAKTDVCTMAGGAYSTENSYPGSNLDTRGNFGPTITHNTRQPRPKNTNLNVCAKCSENSEVTDGSDIGATPLSNDGRVSKSDLVLPADRISLVMSQLHSKTGCEMPKSTSTRLFNLQQQEPLQWAAGNGDNQNNNSETQDKLTKTCTTDDTVIDSTKEGTETSLETSFSRLKREWLLTVKSLSSLGKTQPRVYHNKKRRPTLSKNMKAKDRDGCRQLPDIIETCLTSNDTTKTSIGPEGDRSKYADEIRNLHVTAVVCTESSFIHGLSELPKSWTAMRIIQLNNCSLNGNAIRDGWQVLRNLQVIDFSRNNIEFIDAECMPNLTSMNLSFNQIEKFEDIGGPYLKLLELNLTSNAISRIDHGWVSCMAPNLHSLILNGNLITRDRRVDCRYDLVSFVSDLDLSDNQYCELEENFTQCLVCVRLNMSSNLITQLPFTGFHGPLLQHLILDKNNLSSLAPLANSWLPCLEDLSANYNKISDLPTFLCPKLTRLCLHHNAIKDINQVRSSLNLLPTMRSLDIRNNPCVVDANLTSCILEYMPLLTEFNGIKLCGSSESIKPPNQFTDGECKCDLDGSKLRKGFFESHLNLECSEDKLHLYVKQETESTHLLHAVKVSGRVAIYTNRPLSRTLEDCIKTLKEERQMAIDKYNAEVGEDEVPHLSVNGRFENKTHADSESCQRSDTRTEKFDIATEHREEKIKRVMSEPSLVEDGEHAEAMKMTTLTTDIHLDGEVNNFGEQSEEQQKGTLASNNNAVHSNFEDQSQSNSEPLRNFKKKDNKAPGDQEITVRTSAAPTGKNPITCGPPNETEFQETNDQLMLWSDSQVDVDGFWTDRKETADGEAESGPIAWLPQAVGSLHLDYGECSHNRTISCCEDRDNEFIRSQSTLETKSD